MLSLLPTESDVYRAMRTFLLGMLPSGDAVFSGSISGDQLTVGAISDGTINIGDAVLGENVQANTTIAAFGTGTGGVGVYTVAPSQDDVPATTMSTGIEVIQSQVNRVPEPKTEDFVLMTTLRQPRLSTNLDLDADVVLLGSIAGTIMAVSSIEHGAVRIGATLFGPGVASGTVIRGAGASPGLYVVSPSQTVPQARLAAGGKTITQATQVAMQLDVHGPTSFNNSTMISAVFRDEFATEAFEAINPLITPLFADDPRQMPFSNAEQQIETRWIIEANLQVNYTITVSQQYADTTKVVAQSVDVTPYPST
jgi:hypothetical protein